MADVFISYCRSEATSNLVRQIAGELDAMGISCWYDTQGLNVGDIADFIKEEIEQCKVFLLLLDKSANQSSYVYSEVCASFPLYGKQITPIPVQIGPFAIKGSLWFRLNGYNILSCDTAETVPTDELTRKIAVILHKTPQQLLAPLIPSAPPQVIREPNPPQPSVALMWPTRPQMIDSGKCGDSVFYTLTDNGILTIFGVGPIGITVRTVMSDYLTWFQPWLKWRHSIFCVSIEYGVTSIEKFAFFGCKNLTIVDIPDSVTYIGESAFRSCDRLADVSVPKNAVIEETAFDQHTAVALRI